MTEIIPDLTSWQWWAPFLTVVVVSAILTFGFTEKATRWHKLELIGAKAIMWAEMLAVPVCVGIGWYSGYQRAGDPLTVWGGIVGGLLGSMASPWMMPFINKALDNFKNGKKSKSS